ncbi:MAG: hypothetical protein JJ934_00885 [Pseudomonadales bacterium]|nr:hypothetical protein [Pseudomonadales bacterium]MBO6701163.1 hypothetical protein [Pseudomonadales bacterium]MBO7004990.1 hypothetical protein [Pseudomonadales bacterium]
MYKFLAFVLLLVFLDASVDECFVGVEMKSQHMAGSVHTIERLAVNVTSARLWQTFQKNDVGS